MKRDSATLEAGYNWRHRTYELVGMTAAAVLAVWLLLRIVKAPTSSWFLWPLSAFFGMVLADFVSGFVHWMFDTWWTPETKVVGQLAVRTFRQHHIDPKAMTKHDFVETNGHNWALTPIYSGLGLWAVCANPSNIYSLLVGQSFLIGTAFVMVTSQFHKWAHMDDPGKFVRFLQWSGIALNAKHHNKHHGAPYDQHYCVLNGIMNRPLQAIGFFRGLEAIITKLTGAIPRADDIGEAAALATAPSDSASETAQPSREL